MKMLVQKLVQIQDRKAWYIAATERDVNGSYFLVEWESGAASGARTYTDHDESFIDLILYFTEHDWVLRGEPYVKEIRSYPWDDSMEWFSNVLRDVEAAAP